MNSLSLVVLMALLGSLPACSWHKKSGLRSKKVKKEKINNSFDETAETVPLKKGFNNPSGSARTVYYGEDID